MFEGLDWTAILPFIAVGFCAQMVDGALGMAFGVISNTLLLGLGVPPAAASAGVHTVETFTTAVSGISHAIHRNVNWRMFFRLMIPGVIGGILGAYVLSNIHASVAKPFILAYLSAIGLYLLWRGWRYPPQERKPRIVEPLGLVGGFLDAAGGRSSPRTCSSRAPARAKPWARSTPRNSSSPPPSRSPSSPSSALPPSRWRRSAC